MRRSTDQHTKVNGRRQHWQDRSGRIQTFPFTYVVELCLRRQIRIMLLQSDRLCFLCAVLTMCNRHAFVKRGNLPTTMQ